MFATIAEALMGTQLNALHGLAKQLLYRWQIAFFRIKTTTDMSYKAIPIEDYYLIVIDEVDEWVKEQEGNSIATK